MESKAKIASSVSKPYLVLHIRDMISDPGGSCTSVAAISNYQVSNKCHLIFDLSLKERGRNHGSCDADY